MAKYEVHLDFTEYTSIEVEAEDAEEALEKAEQEEFKEKHYHGAFNDDLHRNHVQEILLSKIVAKLGN